jgi:ATP-dependent RNA helicase RhlE
VNQNPQVRSLQHGVDILIATPGRLLDLMNQGFVDLSSVEIFVLDEADRMLDMGFMPDLKRIITKLPTVRQTVFFSATMPPEIERLANSILKDPVRIVVAPVKATTELIEQSVYHVPKAHKPRLLTSFLTSRYVARALVFTKTKHGADRVAKDLNKAGIRADAIHGNKSQSARQRTLASFKNNEMQVLVATDLAARGLDVDGISHVLNYDLPIEAETYIHRIGRTGRAGAAGIAVSFCDGEERRQLKAIERLLRKELAVERQMPEGMPAISQSQAEAGRDSGAPAASRSAAPDRKPVGRSGGSKNQGRSRRRRLSSTENAVAELPRHRGNAEGPSTKPKKRRRFSAAGRG